MDKIPNHNRERFGVTPSDCDPPTLNNKVLFSSQFQSTLFVQKGFCEHITAPRCTSPLDAIGK